jgi:hypothetical protein
VGDRGVASLLEALRSPGSCGDAWVEFLESYSPVLYQTAGACTSDDDAAADCYLFICEQLARNSFRRLLKFKPDGSASFATWRLASQVTPFRPIHLSWERIPGLAFCEYCTAIGLDVGTMNAVNQTIQCPAIFRFNWNSSLYYRVYMTVRGVHWHTRLRRPTSKSNATAWARTATATTGTSIPFQYRMATAP